MLESLSRVSLVGGQNAERKIMRFDYGPDVDALYLRSAETKMLESEEVQSGIILDFDEERECCWR